MWDEKGPLRLIGAGDLYAILDVHQPGTGGETGVYRDGPIVGRTTKGDANMPAGTLLYGHLWTGPGIASVGDPNVEAVIARYTEVLLPDGRKFPVCIVLGNTRQSRWEKVPGSKPGATILPREVPVSAVSRWPRADP